MRSRSRDEFSRFYSAEMVFIDQILPFQYKIESDFYYLFKTSFLPESLIADSVFLDSMLLYQI